MSLLRRRMMMQTEGDEDMKEWQLFKTIDFSNEDEQLEFAGVDFSDIFIIATGLCHAKESLSSRMFIKINDNAVAMMSTQPVNGSNARNQQLLLRYNGLFWEQTLMPQSNNESSYYTSYGNKQAPYSAMLNVGKCEKLALSESSNAYPISSGTLKIYAR